MWWRDEGSEVKLGEGDRELLRELAGCVAEIASDPSQQAKARLWTAHNDLKDKTPLVLVFPEGSWRELMDDAQVLKCRTPYGRGIEKDLRVRIYYAENLKDDNPIENVFKVRACVDIGGCGLCEQRTASEQDTGAGHYEQVIKGPEDIGRMRMPEIVIDNNESAIRLDAARDIFGDILDVRLNCHFPRWFAPVDEYAKLRGLDTIFYDMIDCPELVHSFCSSHADIQIATLKHLESENVLTLQLDNDYSGSGGNCYTQDLPAEGFDGHPRLRDFWGFATAQMFSEVSPEMHEEFALRHERRFLDLFGMNCYGCCEPLHNKLDAVIRNVPRLRRISISPWADISKSASILQDKYIFSWKPNPAILAGEKFNPELVRTSIKEFCEKTRGCVTEIIMKDTHTVRSEPRRIHEWVRIAKEIRDEFV